jgi:hypothetical protein
MNWEDLNDDQKIWYRKSCRKFIGNKFMGAYVEHEDGEPLYFDDKGYLIKFQVVYNFLIKKQRKEKLESFYKK